MSYQGSHLISTQTHSSRQYR